MRPAVAALLSDPAARREISHAVGARCAIRYAADRLDLLRSVRTAAPPFVVIECRDAAGRPTSGTVRSLREIRPTVPILVRVCLTAPDVRAVMDLARAGATDVLVPGGHAPLASALDAALLGRADRSAAIVQLIAHRCPPEVRRSIEYCVENAASGGSVADLAHAVGVSRRVLTNRMVAAGLPSPAMFFMRCRLAVAADQLISGSATVDQAAHRVGLSSGNALRNALRRHAGMSASDVRTEGDIGRLASLLFATAAWARAEGQGAVA